MVANAKKMAAAYSNLKAAIEKAQSNLATNFPTVLNRENANKLKSLLDNCNNKVSDDINLIFKTQCQNTGFTISNIINYIDLVPIRETELQMTIGNFLKEEPKKEEKGQPKKVQFTINKKVMTAKEYRGLLAYQIQALAGVDNEQLIDLEIIS